MLLRYDSSMSVKFCLDTIHVQDHNSPVPSSSSQLTQYKLARVFGYPKQSATVSVGSVLQ
jgi:hypothetical protein